MDLARPRSETYPNQKDIPRWLAPLLSSTFFSSTHTHRILHGFLPVARLVPPRSFDLDTVFSLCLSFTPLPLVVCLYVFCEHTQKWTHVLSFLFLHFISFAFALDMPKCIYTSHTRYPFSPTFHLSLLFFVFCFFFAFFSPTPSIPAAQPSHLSSSSTSPFPVV